MDASVCDGPNRLPAHLGTFAEFKRKLRDQQKAAVGQSWARLLMGALCLTFLVSTPRYSRLCPNSSACTPLCSVQCKPHCLVEAVPVVKPLKPQEIKCPVQSTSVCATY